MFDYRYSVGNKEARAEIYQCWGAGRVVEKGVIEEVRLEPKLHVFINLIVGKKPKIMCQVLAECWV